MKVVSISNLDSINKKASRFNLNAFLIKVLFRF